MSARASRSSRRAHRSAAGTPYGDSLPGAALLGATATAKRGKLTKRRQRESPAPPSPVVDGGVDSSNYAFVLGGAGAIDDPEFAAVADAHARSSRRDGKSSRRGGGRGGSPGLSTRRRLGKGPRGSRPGSPLRTPRTERSAVSSVASRELMQPEVVTAKKLTLPYLDQFEYVRLQLQRRGVGESADSFEAETMAEIATQRPTTTFGAAGFTEPSGIGVGGDPSFLAEVQKAAEDAAAAADAAIAEASGTRPGGGEPESPAVSVESKPESRGDSPSRSPRLERARKVRTGSLGDLRAEARAASKRRRGSGGGSSVGAGGGLSRSASSREAFRRRKPAPRKFLATPPRGGSAAREAARRELADAASAYVEDDGARSVASGSVGAGSDSDASFLGADRPEGRLFTRVGRPPSAGERANKLSKTASDFSEVLAARRRRREMAATAYVPISGDSAAFAQAKKTGKPGLTQAERDAGMSPETFELSGYTRWEVLLTAAGAPPGGMFKPKVRPVPWVLQLIEEIYNARYDFELKESARTAKLAYKLEQEKQARLSGPIDLSRPPESMIADVRAAAGKRGAGKAIPIDLPQFTYQFMSTHFGLPRVVLQACWDLVYNVEVLRSSYADAQIFSDFLRELAPAEDLLFYLRAREVAQRIFGIQLKTKEKLTEVAGSTRKLPPELSVALVDHPRLGAQFAVMEAHLNPMAVYQLLQQLLGDDALAKFQCLKLDESGKCYSEVAGFRTKLVEVNKLLRLLLKDFQQTDEDIIRKMKYGDDGKGMEQLNKLRSAMQNAEDRAPMEVALEELLHELESLKVEHQALERKNLAAGGAFRTQVFIAAGRVAKKEHDIALARSELKAAQEREEATWGDVMGAVAAAKMGKESATSKTKDTALLRTAKKRAKKKFTALDDGSAEVPEDSQVSATGYAAGASSAKRPRRRFKPKQGGLIPVCETIDGAVLRFAVWTAAQLQKRKMAIATVNLMADTWKKQLEDIKMQAIVRIQRGWRARVKRLAREKAALEEQARIRARKKRAAAAARAAAEKHEAEAKARRDKLEAKRLEAQARKAEEARKKRERVLAYRRETAEKRRVARQGKIKRDSFKRWYLFLTLTKRKREITNKWLAELMRRWRLNARLWGTFRKAATKIQSMCRTAVARTRFKELRRLTAQRNIGAQRVIARIRNRAAAICFNEWGAYVDRQRRIKAMMRSALQAAEQYAFDKWWDYWKPRHDAKVKVALHYQSKFRGDRARRVYARRKRRYDAATCIQSAYKGYRDRKLVAELMVWKRETEAKIRKFLGRLLNQVLYRSFSSWGQYAMRMAQAKRMMRRQLDRGTRSRFERWFEYAEDCKAAKLDVAKALQNRFRQKRAIYAVRKLMREHRAASYIQRYYRQNRGYRFFRKVMARHRAAKDIQRVYRGYVARVSAAWLRLYRDCAIAIQRVFRGHLGRRRFRQAVIDRILEYATTKNFDMLQRAFNMGETFVVDTLGENALMKAAVAGSRRCVKLCLRHSIDPNHRNHEGDGVLHLVIKKRPWYPEHAGVVHYLITHGANPELPDALGNTALILAAEMGRVDIVDILIEENVQLEVANNSGLRALHLAAAFNHTLCVKSLVEAKVAVNLPDVDGVTPLHDVAAKGYINVAKWLIHGGADVNAKDNDGWNPVGFAITNDRHAMAEFLLNEGTDPENHDEGGRTLMHYVASVDKPKFVPLLVAADAHINATDAEGDTALHEAAIRGHHNTVKILLEHGLDPNIQDENGDAAVHLACAKGHVEVVRLLLDYDCELNVKNFDGRTPLGEARFHEQHEVIALIGEQFTLTDRPAAEIEEEARQWDARIDQEKNRLYWVHKETGEITWHDPSAAPTKLLVRRQMAVEGEGDVTVTDYRATWEVTHKEIEESRMRTQAALHMQRVFRGDRARRKVQALKDRLAAGELLTRVAKGCLARRYVRQLRRDTKAAVKIQTAWRGFAGRRYAYWYRIERDQRLNEEWGAAIINRVYRGYKFGRQVARRIRWRRDGPQTFEQWKTLKTQARVKRTFNVWEERVVPGTHDVYFYHNRFAGDIQWDQPPKWKAADAVLVRQREQLRTRGYTDEMWDNAVFMQARWRGRKEREAYARLLKAIRLGHDAEDKYLQNPRSWPNICNYMLYLSALKHDYDRARPLYIRAMEYMAHRGPDNAFILYSFSFYLLATMEEDFSTIMELLARAKAADRSGKSFELAELGFFRHALLRQPHGAQACLNWANIRAHLYQDYDDAEKYYLRALVAAPKNKCIIDNFNHMLEVMAGKDYNGFDAFRTLQEQQAIAADESMAEEWKARQWYAARTLQAAYRGLRTRKIITMVKDAVAEELSELEEVEDGEGGVYYYNTQTGESSWTRPTTKERLEQLRKLGVLDGELGALEGALASELRLRPGDPSLDEGDDADDWVEVPDEQDPKTKYWYNAQTGAVQWERPQFKKSSAIRLLYGRRGLGGVSLEEMIEEGSRPATASGGALAAPAEAVALEDTTEAIVPVESVVPVEPAPAEEEAAVVEVPVSDLAALEGSGDHDRRESAVSSESDIGIAAYGITGTGEVAADLDEDAEALFGSGHVQQEDAAPTGGPEEWEEASDPATGRAYWINKITGESSWVEPSGMRAAPYAQAEAEDPAPAVGGAGGPPTAAAAAADDDVPTDAGEPHAAGEAEEGTEETTEWEEAVDPATGSTYFYNSVTGESTWERPSILNKVRAVVAVGGIGALVGAAEAKETPDAIEDGSADDEWEEVEDDEGNTYYCALHAAAASPLHLELTHACVVGNAQTTERAASRCGSGPVCGPRSSPSCGSDHRRHSPALPAPRLRCTKQRPSPTHAKSGRKPRTRRATPTTSTLRLARALGRSPHCSRRCSPWRASPQAMSCRMLRTPSRPTTVPQWLQPTLVRTWMPGRRPRTRVETSITTTRNQGRALGRSPRRC